MDSGMTFSIWITDIGMFPASYFSLAPLQLISCSPWAKKLISQPHEVPDLLRMS